MTNRENYISIARRTGYDYMPVNFNMCPSLREKYEAWRRENDLTLPASEGILLKDQKPLCPAIKEKVSVPVRPLIAGVWQENRVLPPLTT